MAGWMRIVTPVLINGFGGRLLNIHPSLLPSFKGMDAVGQALSAGVRIGGCTVHLVNEELDAGQSWFRPPSLFLNRMMRPTGIQDPGTGTPAA